MVAHDIHWSGGMERALAELVAQAHDRVDFEVVSATLAPELRQHVRWHRVRVPARPFPLKFLTFFLLAWWRSRRLDVDLVHTCGAIVPMKVDIVSVHFCHRGFIAVAGLFPTGDEPLLRRANMSLTRILSLVVERWCYRRGRVGRLACVSRGLEAEVRVAYPGVPTALTPNGVDLERFRRNAEARDALRAAEGLPPTTVLLLFVGGDWNRKGLHTAIEALAWTTARDGARPTLWVVGSGDVSRYTTLARQHGVSDNVVFFGRREDTERFYAAADVFVMPSSYETFSLVAMEAGAASVPIVGTSVHGVIELIHAGGGVLVDQTAEDLGRGISQLMDPEFRRRAGGAARAFVEDLPWSRSVDSVLALYRELTVADEAPSPARPGHS